MKLIILQVYNRLNLILISLVLGVMMVGVEVALACRCKERLTDEQALSKVGSAVIGIAGRTTIDEKWEFSATKFEVESWIDGRESKVTNVYVGSGSCSTSFKEGIRYVVFGRFIENPERNMKGLGTDICLPSREVDRSFEFTNELRKVRNIRSEIDLEKRKR